MMDDAQHLFREPVAIFITRTALPITLEALLSFRASRHCRSRSPLSMVIDQMAAGSHGRGSDLLARQALGARRI
jgi:hypothetical protein